MSTNPAAAAAAEAKTKQQLNFFESFMLSGVAAGVSKTTAAPIERVKLLVQNQGEMLKQGVLDRPYGSVTECIRRTWVNEGVRSFWRGNLTNNLRYFPTQALNFAFKDTIQGIFVLHKNESHAKRFAKNILSGGCAACLSTTIVYSLDYARTRLTNDVNSGSGKRKFTGIFDVYRKTLASDGVLGLYRGFTVSCVGIFVYRGLYFGLYDSLKPILLGDDNPSAVLSFGIGWGVTIVAGYASYPIDTIRRRMMMTSGEIVKYRGAVDCGMQILRKEGPVAMMKGAGANVVCGLSAAGVLVGFDVFKDVYIRWRLGSC